METETVTASGIEVQTVRQRPDRWGRLMTQTDEMPENALVTYPVHAYEEVTYEDVTYHIVDVRDILAYVT